MCTLLGTALSRVPNGVLRSKFVGSVQLLGSLVEQHRQQVRLVQGTVIAAVAAVSQLLHLRMRFYCAATAAWYSLCVHWECELPLSCCALAVVHSNDF